MATNRAVLRDEDIAEATKGESSPLSNENTEGLKPKATTRRRDHVEHREPWWVLKSLGWDMDTDDVPEELIEHAYRFEARKPVLPRPKVANSNSDAKTPAKDPAKHVAVAAPDISALKSHSQIMGALQDPQILLRQADNKIPTKSSGGGWFSSLFSGGDTFEDKAESAGDLYQSAALAFTNQKQDLKAARAYRSAAGAYVKANLNHNAARQYIQAWDRYEKTQDVLEGIPCLETAIALFATVQGNFSMAGTNQENLAVFYENADKRRPALKVSQDQILAAYQLALDHYENANSVKASSMGLKVAEYAALTGDVQRATQTIDNAIRASSMNPKTSALTSNYTPMGALIHLASNDPISFDRAMQWYLEVDNYFANSRKPQMIYDLAGLVEQGDEDKFEEAVRNYTRQNLLQENTAKIVKMIQRSIEKREDDFS